MISSLGKKLAIVLINQATTSGARQHKTCELLGTTSRTIQRWRKLLKDKQPLTDQRKVAAELRDPPNKLSKQEQERILEISNTAEYRSLPPSQIVPRLADTGIFIASESSFYRVLRKEGQINRRGTSERPKSVSKPTSYLATRPNSVWSWDITYLASSIRGSFYRLYLVMDVFSRKIVGWEVHERETAEHASELIRKSCLKESIHKKGLVLHSDNGGPMKGATMLSTLQRLGVVPSFSRPSVSDDNPYSESLFKTLKYMPSYPNKPFESFRQARQWVYGFAQWYNHEHRHSALKFVTPHQRHAGEDRDILRKRVALYEEAKLANPKRWSRTTRNWEYVEEVWLNPSKEHQVESQNWAKAG